MEDKQQDQETTETEETQQVPMNRAERRAAAKGKSLPGDRPIPGLRSSNPHPHQAGGGTGPHQKRGSTPRKSGTG